MILLYKMINIRSSMIGDLSEEEFRFVESEDMQVAGYIRTMRIMYGRFVVDAAVLDAEVAFSGKHLSGETLYSWLTERGYGAGTSRTVLNEFVSNNELNYDLLNRNNEYASMYDSTYDDRLRSSGLVERRYYMNFLMDYIITVAPIDYDVVALPELPIEEPPIEEPPIEGPSVPTLYKNTQFQIQASMRLTYADKKGRHLEIFGTFWALDDFLDDAIPKGVILLNDFAVSKGYGALTEDGSGWAYTGAVEDLDMDYLTAKEVVNNESEARVWIDDVDYSRPERFSARATMLSRWWNDEVFDDARRRFDNETSL